MEAHKLRPIKSDKVRKSANGQACTLRSDFCTDNGTNVMLCHVPLKGMAGGSQKAHDIHSFYGCMGCHTWFDGDGRDDEARWPMALRAVFETQNILYELGLIKVTGNKN